MTISQFQSGFDHSHHVGTFALAAHPTSDLQFQLSAGRVY